MKFKKKIILSYLLFILLLISCNKNKKADFKYNNEFKFIQKNIDVSNKILINDCANWYLEFKEIKKTVFFKRYIISMGLYGGFICLNESDLSLNTEMGTKLNTDFYTNITVFQDTLLAEKFEQLYFFGSDSIWHEYQSYLPIQYFDILYQNDEFVVFSSCSGEFGSIIFFYNKNNKTTKIALDICPNSVINTDSGFIINSHLYHMSGHSSIYLIKDIDKLNLVPDTLYLFHALWDRDPRFEYVRKVVKPNNCIPIDYLNSVDSRSFDYPIIVSTFINNKELFHFVDFKGYADSVFLCLIKKGCLIKLDSFANISPKTAINYSGTTIINEKHGQGFTFIRNDSIFKIIYKTQSNINPSSQDYSKIFYFKGIEEVNDLIQYTYNSSIETNFKIRSGHHEREIEYTFNNYQIIAFSDDQINEVIVRKGTEEHQLKFRNNWNYVQYIFTCKNNLAIYFENLGGYNHKYGLIEITNFEKFISIYSEKTRVQ
ncbi:hypothetical protein ACFLRI_03660 [Bacteroidota bacterium]